MASHKILSNLDLVNIVDSFPNASTHPSLHAERLSTLSVFTHKTYKLGYLIPSVISALKDTTLSGTHWNFSGDTVSLSGDTVAERSENIKKTIKAWKDTGKFEVLKGWRDELYNIYCPPGKLYLAMERSACALLGVVTYGVHMTAYTTSPLRIWTPTRNPKKPTYGGMLDNTVAGGIPSGMSVHDTLVKESEEEASFPASLINEKAKAVGAVSYFYLRHKSAGGEEGLLQPEVEYCYDMEVGEDIIPRPNDDEVQDFKLLDIETVKEELSKGMYKPNCSLVLLDFFIRHNILTATNEPDYIEICSRIHRHFEFPTW